ncbi:hypothetical protein L2E82_51256 [Cichorium intybus]|nr:hypothetical protein L2E82_51256 [Cichorium intybus]
MGDLILSNKRAQTLPSKQNVAEPNCSRSRAKRKLVLVDEDDEIYQDVNEANLELDGSKDYVNEGECPMSQDGVGIQSVVNVVSNLHNAEFPSFEDDGGIESVDNDTFLENYSPLDAYDVELNFENAVEDQESDDDFQSLRHKTL